MCKKCNGQSCDNANLITGIAEAEKEPDEIDESQFEGDPRLNKERDSADEYYNVDDDTEFEDF